MQDPPGGWDGVAGKLLGEPPGSVPAAGGREKLPWGLLTIMVIMLCICGFLTHYLIIQCRQLRATELTITEMSKSGTKSANSKEIDTSTKIRTRRTLPPPVIQKLDTPTIAQTVVNTGKPNGPRLEAGRLVSTSKSHPLTVQSHTDNKTISRIRYQPSASSSNNTHSQSQPRPIVVDSPDKNTPVAQHSDAPAETKKDSSPKNHSDTTITKAADNVRIKDKIDSAIGEKKGTVFPQKKGFLIGIASGPEWNQVKRQRFTRTGYDLGLLAGYQFNNKLSIEASAFFARKFYYSSGKYFKAQGMDVVSLEGSSTIFEVPLKLKYNLLNKTSSTLFASAGMISYFLTDEKNDYILLVNGGEMNMHAAYPNASRYFAAALDISAGYERQFGKLTNVRIEPYVQLPLKGIGVGSMEVMSTGVHVVISKLLMVKGRFK